MRRASFTLSSEQHGRSGTSSPWQNSFIVAPTTSYPWRTSSAAATEESTPPLIATRTRSRIRLSRRRQTARLLGQHRKHLGNTIDARLGGERAKAEPDRRLRDVRRDAERLEHV